MDASTIGQTAATPAASTSAAASSQKTLASNFDTFLTLLTAQLKNQDPLSPMDSSQFTQQLVQFSQVEQQIASNKNLELLISLAKSSSANSAVSYLGKTLTLDDGTAALQNGQAQWTYGLANNAATTNLTVTDSKGRVVYSGSGNTTAGAHSFAWDGKDRSGNTLPDGVYSLSVQAAAAGGTAIKTAVESAGIIGEVDLSGSEPNLIVGPISVPLSKATHISAN